MWTGPASADVLERVTWSRPDRVAIAGALDAGTGDLALKVLVYCWGAVEPGVLASLKELCGQEFLLVGAFGQTEAISCHRFWPDQEWRKYVRAGSGVNYFGIPNPLLASTIMDFDGSSLLDKPGMPGEAVYRSPAVAAGYYRDLPATEDAFRHGWFHSGDSCVVDDDGLRIMVDRYKDIIKSGGENVSSIRVEAVLHEHPQEPRPPSSGWRTTAGTSSACRSTSSPASWPGCSRRHRFSGVLEGTTPVPEFFAPESLGRILAREAVPVG